MSKIGAGAAGAALRQGAKELTQVLPAFNDGIKPVEEPGAVGNLTPSEVLETKEADVSFDAQLAQAAQAAKGRSNEKEMDRE